MFPTSRVVPSRCPFSRVLTCAWASCLPAVSRLRLSALGCLRLRLPGAAPTCVCLLLCLLAVPHVPACGHLCPCASCLSWRLCSAHLASTACCRSGEISRNALKISVAPPPPGAVTEAKAEVGWSAGPSSAVPRPAVGEAGVVWWWPKQHPRQQLSRRMSRGGCSGCIISPAASLFSRRVLAASCCFLWPAVQQERREQSSASSVAPPPPRRLRRPTCSHNSMKLAMHMTGAHLARSAWTSSLQTQALAPPDPPPGGRRLREFAPSAEPAASWDALWSACSRDERRASPLHPR